MFCDFSPVNETVAKLIVATDLDATLLDHQTYDYSAALPAIARLKSNGCPIVFNSSKTQAEQTMLRKALGIDAPFIVENGAAVVIPPGQLGVPKAATPEVKTFGPAHGDLIEHIRRLREQQGFQFKGFSDLTAEAVAQLTGLSVPEAAAAKQRMGSEPLQWKDSEAAFEQFSRALAEVGLQTTRGGRFRHVMAEANKGNALQWLVSRYRNVFPQVQWTVVALGDSPNDLPMLQAADVGVLIENPHRAPFEVTDVERLLRPKQPGPTGWASAIAQLCDEILNR